MYPVLEKENLSFIKLIDINILIISENFISRLKYLLEQEHSICTGIEFQ